MSRANKNMRVWWVTRQTCPCMGTPKATAHTRTLQKKNTNRIISDIQFRSNIIRSPRPNTSGFLIRVGRSSTLFLVFVALAAINFDVRFVTYGVQYVHKNIYIVLLFSNTFCRSHCRWHLGERERETSAKEGDQLSYIDVRFSWNRFIRFNSSLMKLQRILFSSYSAYNNVSLFFLLAFYKYNVIE